MKLIDITVVFLSFCSQHWKTKVFLSHAHARNERCIPYSLYRKSQLSANINELQLKGSQNNCIWAAADKTNKMTCAPSEDSAWASAQSDQSLPWAHRSFCWFGHAAVHLMIKESDYDTARWLVVPQALGALFCPKTCGICLTSKNMN